MGTSPPAADGKADGPIAGKGILGVVFNRDKITRHSLNREDYAQFFIWPHEYPLSMHAIRKNLVKKIVSFVHHCQVQQQ
jgi:hypothetical protein